MATTKDDKDFFLELVKTKLNGKAYNVVKYKTFVNWNELKTDLTSQFSESRPIEQLQVDLVKIRQQKNESVKSFATRIEELLSQLTDACIKREGPDATNVIQNLNNTTALKSFEDGLRDPIKLIIKACRFTDLQQAITKAIEEESTLKDNFHASGSNKYTEVTKNFKITCQFCKKPGHSADICYSIKSQIPSNTNNFSKSTDIKPNFPQRTNSSFVRKYNVSCAYCHKPGHHISVCRKRQFNEFNRRSDSTGDSQIPSTSKQSFPENLNTLEKKSKSTSARVGEL